jgi:hypothetical protein
MKAHIGGNQVMGLSSSSTSRGRGADRGRKPEFGAGLGTVRVEGTECSIIEGYA